ncbi:hypothetical protein LMJ38_19155 [Streptomyces sp. R1]|uniref:hypothetical protein n=1 Tax=Streptomyces TaxID=1883 RepID=UPI00052AF671|nr:MULTISPECIES: hypothetical protein [unclassified Streptomyces]AIV32318.1 hypothetical protein NI25_01275 [Streptomyces sp. CCM_MD2014]MCC8338042.1 hypothetical protein [Streptomyces sp. R1]MDA4890412.1 hypothetical protein [Streptomyces sp. MS2A]MYS52628.1 hypothetical protein [Streptomyces sp. SID6013]
MPLTAAARPHTTDLRGARRPAPLGAAEAEVLRIVTDARTPVFVTVRADGRRRYSYWRPLDSGTGRGGCYVALPTAVCDALHAAGRTTLGEPLADPDRITYRVSATRTPAAPLHALPRRARAA